VPAGGVEGPFSNVPVPGGRVSAVYQWPPGDRLAGVTVTVVSAALAVATPANIKALVISATAMGSFLMRPPYRKWVLRASSRDGRLRVLLSRPDVP
jgi:hypothetical protein